MGDVGECLCASQKTQGDDPSYKVEYKPMSRWETWVYVCVQAGRYMLLTQGLKWSGNQCLDERRRRMSKSSMPIGGVIRELLHDR